MTDYSTLRLPNGYWYMASVYSSNPDGIYVAFRQAAEAAAALLKEGVPVYSPITHTHPIAEFGDMDHYSHDIFMPIDKPMVDAAHGMIVLMMPGWNKSKGIGMEIEWFETANKPVVYLAWPLDTPSQKD